MLDIILACAPTVAPETVQWVIRLESRGDPLAIGINSPDGPIALSRKPVNASDAVALAASYIEKPGYSVDVGLMQINSRNFKRYGIALEQAFDPCVNITTGASILTEAYKDAVKQFGPTPYALMAALSRYNTGSLSRGFSNGYVARYVAAWGGQDSSARVILRSTDAAGAGTAVDLLMGEGISHARTAPAILAPIEQTTAPHMRSASLAATSLPTIPKPDEVPSMSDTRVEIPAYIEDAQDHPPLLSADINDLNVPGVQVELDADDADGLGLVQETALSFSAAWDSNVNHEQATPDVPNLAKGKQHGQ